MKKNPVQNEEGFILMLTMTLLVVLSLIGLTAIRASRVEVKVAGNEKWAQDSFYQADGGAETVISLIEDNAAGKGVKNNPEYSAVYVNKDNFDMQEDTDPVAWRKLDSTFTPNENLIVTSPEDLSTIMSGQKIVKFPATQLQVGKRNIESAGHELKTVPGSDSTPGSSPAHFVIWAHNDGISNSQTDLQVRWQHID